MLKGCFAWQYETYNESSEFAKVTYFCRSTGFVESKALSSFSNVCLMLLLMGEGTRTLLADALHDITRLMDDQSLEFSKAA